MTTVSKGDARAIADLSGGTILACVEIEAPPERVFAAISTAEVAQWWGAPEAYRVTRWTADLRRGGTWLSEGVGPDGKPFSVGGEIVEVEPPRLLVQTWRPSWEPGPATTLSYRIDSIPGGSRVTVRHDGFGDRTASCDSHAQGWERVLSWLKSHLAREPGA